MKRLKGLLPAISADKVLMVMLALVLGLTACPECPADETADIRAIHLSPDAPAVDVWTLEPERRIFSDLSFTDSSTYRVVDEGTYTLEITPSGAGILDSVLTLEGLEFEEDNTYTAAVIGWLDNLTGILLVDDVTTPPADQIRVRIVHAAPDVGEVDVWNVTDPEDPQPLVENVSFAEASDNLNIDAGTYVVGIDVNGDEQPELVFELPQLTAGSILNVFALQDETGEVFLLAHFLDGNTIRINPRPITPELGEDEAGVRLVHLSPEAPPVDVWGPAVPLVTNLNFAEGTDYLAVPADVELVEVVPAGQEREEAVLQIVDPPLMAGEFYTVVVFGELEELSVLLLQDDQTPPVAGAIRLRPVHVAVGVGEVDLWAARPNQQPVLAFENLAFGETTDALELPSGSYSVGLDVGRDGLIEVTADFGPITAATIANIFAAVDEDGQVFFLVQENGNYVRLDGSLEDPPQEPGNVLPIVE